MFVPVAVLVVLLDAVSEEYQGVVPWTYLEGRGDGEGTGGWDRVLGEGGEGGGGTAYVHTSAARHDDLHGNSSSAHLYTYVHAWHYA